MLGVENDSSKEVESGYRQQEKPCVFDILIEVINCRFDVLLSLFGLGSPFFVVVDVQLFLGLIFCVTFDVIFILLIIIREWEALKF